MLYPDETFVYGWQNLTACGTAAFLLWSCDVIEPEDDIHHVSRSNVDDQLSLEGLGLKKK